MYTEYSPPRPKFQTFSLYDQPFSRYKFFENRKSTIWLQNDLKHLSVKYPCIHWVLTPEAHISLSFTLWSLVFQLIEVLWILTICSKSKIKISKIQNSIFVRTTDKKIQEKFEKIQNYFEGGVAFWSLAPIGSHVNENENKLWKIVNSKF